MHARLLSLTSLATGLLALSMTGLISGCKKGGESTSTDGKRQVLHLGNSAEPADIDPHSITGRPESDIVRMVFEGLVTPDPQTLEPRPGQAERWDISADQLTYTFHLRPGITWSDGQPVTARDFVRSWQRILTPSF